MSKTLLACALLTLASCASPPEKPSKYPAQKEGCDVQIFNDTPTMQTDNIGPVSASCDQSIADQDCLRTLKDEACKLGGNVVWGVEPNPTLQLGKKKFFGRAAHTK